MVEIESGKFTYSDYLEGGFIVTVFKIGNEMKLWINQHDVAVSNEVFLDANSNVMLRSQMIIVSYTLVKG